MLNLNRKPITHTPRRDLWNSSLIHNSFFSFFISLLNLILSLMLLCVFFAAWKKMRECTTTFEWVSNERTCVDVSALHCTCAYIKLDWIFIKNEYAHIDESKHSLICAREHRKTLCTKKPQRTLTKLSQPDTRDSNERKIM